MFPGHGFPVSGLSHVPSAQDSTIKPQSCCQSTGFCHQTSVKFPGHRVPESSSVMLPGHKFPPSDLSHVPRSHVSRIKPQSCSQATWFQNQTSVMFPGHRFPQTNLSHVPRLEGSKIKPQSYSQASVFQNQTSVMFPGQRFPNQTSVRFPCHRVPESSISHIPRPDGSTIKPHSYCQATGYNHETSVMFQVQRVP